MFASKIRQSTSRSYLFIAQPERSLEVERFGRASDDGVQHRLSVHHDPAEQTGPVVSVRRCKHTTLRRAGGDLPVVGVVIAPPGCRVHVVVDQPVVGSRADANLLLLLPGEITSVRVKVPQNHNFLKTTQRKPAANVFNSIPAGTFLVRADKGFF